MIAHVAGAGENAEEYEAGGYRCVEHTKEDERRDHEGERDFEIEIVAQGAERRRGVVVGPSVAIDDTADKREEDDLGDGDGPKCFGEVLGLLHLGDERRQRDLADECVADV